MISERYKKLRYISDCSLTRGWKRGWKRAGRKPSTRLVQTGRKRVTKVLEEIGEKLTPEERERLLGTREEKSP